MLLKNRKFLVVLTLLVLLGSSLVLGQDRGGAPVNFRCAQLTGKQLLPTSLRGESCRAGVWRFVGCRSRKRSCRGIRKLADEYSDRGVVVYWVSTESEDQKSKNFASDDQLRAFAQKYGLKVTVLRDADGAVSKRIRGGPVAVDCDNRQTG